MIPTTLDNFIGCAVIAVVVVLAVLFLWAVARNDAKTEYDEYHTKHIETGETLLEWFDRIRGNLPEYSNRTGNHYSWKPKLVVASYDPDTGDPTRINFYAIAWISNGYVTWTESGGLKNGCGYAGD
ncbi:MAG: hypothetical protein V2A34_14025 [Lentisphaerota bacterium]